MNRRSMLKMAFGACAAMCAPLLLPWRKAETNNGEVVAVADPKCIGPVWGNGQIARIKRLLDQYEREQNESTRRFRTRLTEAMRSNVRPGSPACQLTTVTYRPTVQRRHKTDLIEIWIDGDTPWEDGLYDCGLIVISATCAASLDDAVLLTRLKKAFTIVITPPCVSRQGLLEQFKGRPVVLLADNLSVLGEYTKIS